MNYHTGPQQPPVHSAAVVVVMFLVFAAQCGLTMGCWASGDKSPGHVFGGVLAVAATWVCGGVAAMNLMERWSGDVLYGADDVWTFTLTFVLWPVALGAFLVYPEKRKGYSP